MVYIVKGLIKVIAFATASLVLLVSMFKTLVSIPIVNAYTKAFAIMAGALTGFGLAFYLISKLSMKQVFGVPALLCVFLPICFVLFGLMLYMTDTTRGKSGWK